MSYSTCLRFPTVGAGVDVSSLSSFTSSPSSSNDITYNNDFQLYDSSQGFLHPSQATKRAPTSSPQQVRFRNQPHPQYSDPLQYRSLHNEQEQVVQEGSYNNRAHNINNQWQSLPNTPTNSCMQQAHYTTNEGLAFTPLHQSADNGEVAYTQTGSAQYDWALPHLKLEQPFEDQYYTSQAPAASLNENVWQPQLDGNTAVYAPKSSSTHTSVRHNTLIPRTYPFNTLVAPHRAMQAFAVDHQYLDDGLPEFGHSSRHSMSSMGNASPATPPGLDDSVEDTVAKNVASNPAHAYAGLRAHSNLQLFRTESQAFQDELYNPSQEQASSKPTIKPTTINSSSNPTIMSSLLQAANENHSQSPRSTLSRDRSPFRANSPYAPASDWRSPAGMGTAASMRRNMKEQAEKAELAQHMPKLRREPTKTMSPKDAVLDINDGDQPSLFQDSIPIGYKQHNTGESWFQNMSSATATPFQSMQHTMQHMPAVTMGFRPDATTTTLPADTFSFDNMMQPGPNSAHGPAPVFNGVRSSQYLSPADATPHFPPTLTSMESSISDNGPSSSADSARQPIQRPADTRANTGTYTCTYHGCIERFHSQPELQRHKREVHRPQQYLQVESQSSPRGSTGSSLGDDDASAADDSPRSSTSPEPSGTGMTSAAIMARNSQAGPHKCTRINPTTGKPCNTIFSRPYDLTRHEDTIHNNRKEKVRCQLCHEEKTFSRNDALTRHMRVVHPEVESHGKRGRRD